jgi:hypothetical protein
MAKMFLSHWSGSRSDGYPADARHLEAQLQIMQVGRCDLGSSRRGSLATKNGPPKEKARPNEAAP